MSKDKKNQKQKIGIVSIKEIGKHHDELMYVEVLEILSFIHPDTMISPPIKIKQERIKI